MKPLPKAIVIMGTTGIGKSTISSKVRNILGGELISCDSVKLYRGLRIGSHKVYDPHHKVHMYDVVGINDHYTVQQYAEMAHECTKDIFSRGKTPIYFGGANMYMEWLLFGTGSAPNTDRKKMEQVEERLRKMSCWDEAVNYAMPMDPEGVQKLNRNDYYRLSRVVTIAEDKNEKFSDLQGFETPQMELDLRGAFVYPEDRSSLYRSLDRRCEKMLADGLLEEVQNLLHLHGGEFPRKIETIVGYRQTIEFLKRYPSNPTPAEFKQYLYAFQSANRDYARRQMMYFRKSKKLNPVFRAIPSLPTMESAERTTEIILELFKMTPEEYAKDPRWRDPIPIVGSKANREYKSKQEVFGNVENVKLLLARLETERGRLKNVQVKI
jgi:tRNA dimethylallyltransferase